ncbi:MAG: glycosyltransferase [Candidatus Symbiothrix sp.]|jgi:alpha-1,3-rhamnosyltransferase|nr:glycosyltransferase [Candidatus Symbiothrix sp.]
MKRITVAVVTYNSSKTIIETLESVKRQTYANIELIISDDHSLDNTLEIIHEWVTHNKDRFVRIELLSSDINRGIVPNRNKCIGAAQGEWIKFVDGDDMLTTNSIESYQRVMDDSVHFIMGDFIELNEKEETKEYLIDTNFFQLDASEQLVLQQQKARILWPGVIHRRETLIRLDGLDERFPMLDDFPFFIKALKAGYKFNGVNAFVFIYRVHSGSAQRSEKFHLSHVNYVNQILVPEYKKEKKYIDYWHDKLWSEKELAKLNNKPAKSALIYLLMLISDPKEWYYIIRNKIYRPVVFKWRELKK